MLDVERVREDFPILKTGIIYLDNTASSLTPEPVLSKMLEFYREYRANVERGVHRLSQRASEEYEKAHSKVARFINAKSEAEIIMTRNATEGLNIVPTSSSGSGRGNATASMSRLFGPATSNMESSTPQTLRGRWTTERGWWRSPTSRTFWE